MPFKLLALQIRALGALCPWFPLGGPWMMLAGGERTSEAIDARHCAAPGWVKVSRHQIRAPGTPRPGPLGWGDSGLPWISPTTNRRGLVSRLTGMSI